MVTSLRLGFPSVFAAVSHCFLLVGYSLPVNSCRTFELVTNTAKSGFVIGTSVASIDLQNCWYQQRTIRIWKQNIVNFNCKGTLHTKTTNIVVWGIAIQYSGHELITQKAEKQFQQSHAWIHNKLYRWIQVFKLLSEKPTHQGCRMVNSRLCETVRLRFHWDSKTRPITNWLPRF